MIETPHAERLAAARARSTRSTARRASRRPRCCDGLDVLVIDLQDVGARIYTYIYTMANCLRACAQARRPRRRLRPPQPDRRRRRRGADARAGLRVVRRPVPDPDAPRHDDRRAGAAVQRALRDRRASSRSCRWTGWSRRMYCDETGAALGHALAQHPDARHAPSSIRARCSSRARWSRRAAARRGRSSWSARRGSRPSASRPAMNAQAPAGRALPAGGVRADVPEARRDDVRRLPDPRARSPRVPAGADRRGADRASSRRGARHAFAWRQPPYEYEHDKMPIDILAGSPGAADGDRCGHHRRGHRGDVAREPAARSSHARERVPPLPLNRWPPGARPRLRAPSACGPRRRGCWRRSSTWQTWRCGGRSRAVTVPCPLGPTPIEWPSTEFKDEVLGRLGGTLHGMVMDYRPGASFFLAEVYWHPPDGDPIGPMALEGHVPPARQRPSTS